MGIDEKRKDLKMSENTKRRNNEMEDKDWEEIGKEVQVWVLGNNKLKTIWFCFTFPIDISLSTHWTLLQYVKGNQWLSEIINVCFQINVFFHLFVNLHAKFSKPIINNLSDSTVLV